jgi:hypothetical protein
MNNEQKESPKEANLSIKELTQLFEKNQLRSLRYDFFEKVSLLLIAALSLITALAWEEAVKITFQEIFRQTDILGGRFVYPIIITFLTVIISLFISRAFLKKTDSKTIE